MPLLKALKEEFMIWARTLACRTHEHQFQTPTGLMLTVTPLNDRRMAEVKNACKRYVDDANRKSPALLFNARWFTAVHVKFREASFYAIYENEKLGDAIWFFPSTRPSVAMRYANSFYINGRVVKAEQAKKIFINALECDLTPEMAVLLYAGETLAVQKWRQRNCAKNCLVSNCP